MKERLSQKRIMEPAWGKKGFVLTLINGLWKTTDLCKCQQLSSNHLPVELVLGQAAEKEKKGTPEKLRFIWKCQHHFQPCCLELSFVSLQFKLKLYLKKNVIVKKYFVFFPFTNLISIHGQQINTKKILLTSWRYDTVQFFLSKWKQS